MSVGALDHALVVAVDIEWFIISCLGYAVFELARDVTVPSITLQKRRNAVFHILVVHNNPGLFFFKT